MIGNGRGAAGRRGLAAIACGVASFVLAAGFAPAASAFSGRMSVESGGVTRSAIVVEHERLKRSRRPVVLVLHGGNGNGARIRRNLGLEDVGRSAGRIIVYPDAIGGHWSDGPGAAASRDVAFIRDLVGKLVSEGIADRRKVFLVGSSTGGMMVLRTLCESGESFAGAAVLIAGLPADLADTCKPARPLPLLMVLGTADALVPYKGGRTSLPDSKIDVLSADSTLSVFARAAGCADTRATTPVPDRDPHDGSRAYIDKFTGCKVPVELVRVEGGGHSIPGRSVEGRVSGAVGTRNNDVDTARLIADFFKPLGD